MEEIHEIMASLCASSFKSFVREFWTAASSDTYVESRLSDCLCEHLQALATGEIKRLAVALPVRHSKSLLSSVMFPAWLWTRDASLRIISATYSKDLTDRDSHRTRKVIESDLYRACYGASFTLDADQNRKDYYSNDKKGHRLAVSTNSATAGKDCDILIGDDLNDYRTRKSQAEMSAALDYFSTTLTSRLVRGKDRIVVCGHRVAENDVFNLIYETYGDDGTWTYLVLPAEGPSPVKFYNGTGFTDWRKEGELLCPERFDKEWYASEKRKLRGEYNTMYMQNPTPSDGNLFNGEWFKSYHEEDGGYRLDGKKVKSEQCTRIATVDLAVSEKHDADYTVCLVADCWNNNVIIKTIHRGRYDGGKVLPFLLEMWNTYKPEMMVVEDVAYQRMVIDLLRRNNVNVKSYKPVLDKEARSITAQVKAEAGQVWLPTGKPWVADFLHEVSVFPKGRHDDMVDCLSLVAIMSQRYDRNRPEEEKPSEDDLRRKHHLKMMNAGL